MSTIKPYLNSRKIFVDPGDPLEVPADNIDLRVALLAGGGLEHVHLVEANTEQIHHTHSLTLKHCKHFNHKAASLKPKLDIR